MTPGIAAKALGPIEGEAHIPQGGAKSENAIVCLFLHFSIFRFFLHFSSFFAIFSRTQNLEDIWEVKIKVKLKLSR